MIQNNHIRNKEIRRLYFNTELTMEQIGNMYGGLTKQAVHIIIRKPKYPIMRKRRKINITF